MASKRGRKKRHHNPGVLRTQVDMAAVYKNNIAEDKKLEEHFTNLKRKERAEIIKHYGEIKEINTRLSDIQLEKDSVTHTFDEDEIKELDKELRREKQRFKDAVEKVQKINRISRNRTNSTAVTSNMKNDSMQRFYNVTNLALQNAFRTNRGGVQNGLRRPQLCHNNDDSDSDENQSMSSLSFSTSSKSRTPSWSNLYRSSVQAHNSTLSNRNSVHFSPAKSELDDSDDESTVFNTGFRRPLSRAVSCRAELSRNQSSLPAIENTTTRLSSDLQKKCSLLRRRRISAAINSPTTSKRTQSNSSQDIDESASDQRLEAIKQDIKSQNTALGERVKNFLDKVSPNATSLPKERLQRRRISLALSY